MTLNISPMHDAMRIEGQLQIKALERTRQWRDAAIDKPAAPSMVSTLSHWISVASHRIGNRLAHPMAHDVKAQSQPVMAGAAPGAVDVPE